MVSASPRPGEQRVENAVLQAVGWVSVALMQLIPAAESYFSRETVLMTVKTVKIRWP